MLWLNELMYFIVVYWFSMDCLERKKEIAGNIWRAGDAMEKLCNIKLKIIEIWGCFSWMQRTVEIKWDFNPCNGSWKNIFSTNSRITEVNTTKARIPQKIYIIIDDDDDDDDDDGDDDDDDNNWWWVMMITKLLKMMIANDWEWLRWWWLWFIVIRTLLKKYD